MEQRLTFVIFSHLSDIQEDPLNKYNNDRINFIKYLLNKYPNNNMIVADDEWKKFQEYFKVIK